MPEISIHDNVVTGYSVFCEKGEIVFHTEFHDRARNEKTDIIFRGVEAYHILGDNMNSILFSVDECPTDQILEDYSSEFETGIQYAWPGPWNESLKACKKRFTETDCRGWIIYSSYGLTGFVVAQSMELASAS